MFKEISFILEMEGAISNPKIYTRLVNLVEKTEHFHIVLRMLRHRMGCNAAFNEILAQKIELKRRLAIELALIVEQFFDVGFLESFVRRPVARFWISNKPLLDASCIAEAITRVNKADMRSYREYGYLLKIDGLPDKLAERLTAHRKLLHEQIVVNEPGAGPSAHRDV